MSKLDQFFDAYAEQTLDDHEQAAFRAWLHEDEAHVEEFARDAFLHWQLLAIGRRRNLQADVVETPLKVERYERRQAVGKTPAAREQSRLRWAPSWRIAVGLIATLTLAASIFVGALLVWNRPNMVAQVTKATAGVAWSGNGKWSAGAFLPAGHVLAIDRGQVLTTLASGVQIVLEGPAELRLVSPSKVFLSMGRMTVAVPRQAMGFVVDSRLGEFVDLGTEYTLKLQPDGGCELHVFSGLVELRPANGTPEEGPLRIPEGRAMRYDASSGKGTNVPYSPAERMTL